MKGLSRDPCGPNIFETKKIVAAPGLIPVRIKSLQSQYNLNWLHCLLGICNLSFEAVLQFIPENWKQSRQMFHGQSTVLPFRNEWMNYLWFMNELFIIIIAIIVLDFWLRARSEKCCCCCWGSGRHFALDVGHIVGPLNYSRCDTKHRLRCTITPFY